MVIFVWDFPHSNAIFFGLILKRCSLNEKKHVDWQVSGLSLNEAGSSTVPKMGVTSYPPSLRPKNAVTRPFAQNIGWHPAAIAHRDHYHLVHLKVFFPNIDKALF